jgi:hypothetical protein
MVVFLFNTVIYVFLLLCLIVRLYTYLMFMYLLYVYIFILCYMYLYRASWHPSPTLTEVFPCFFLSCKANARVKPATDGARPALFLNFCVVPCIVSSVSFSVLFLCKCVLNYCHRVATQLQLTNISYHIILKSARSAKYFLNTSFVLCIGVLMSVKTTVMTTMNAFRSQFSITKLINS